MGGLRTAVVSVRLGRIALRRRREALAARTVGRRCAVLRRRSALQRANRTANAETRSAAIQAAEGYTKQFAATQPNSGLKFYNDLLRGRVLLARGSDADATAAIELFKGIVGSTQRPQTQLQARYHLARAQQKLKQHAAVIETLTPVIEQVRKEGAASEFIDSLVMFASSLLVEKKIPKL